MPIASTNPYTGETVKTFTPDSESEIQRKLKIAEIAFNSYRTSTFSQRAHWMLRAAEILEQDKDALGRIMTLEMGKPIRAAREEAAKCAWVCRYYAENAEKFLTDEIIEGSATRSFVRYQPLGPVLAIMPWNFPFWQVFRFAAPALMAGNVGLLKHASNVPQCALAIEDIFRRAGFSEGVFQTILIDSAQVENVIADTRVKAVTLTGSTTAGSSVASVAGRHIKKTVLELGGSDPFIVMASANVDEAAKIAARARTINNGQSCIAAKRFIVHTKIYDKFSASFVKQMESLRIGDPMEESTEIGPLATQEILSGVDEQVRKSVELGAKVLAGGQPLNRTGYFYPPTIVTEIPKASPAYEEEIFGPVASLFRVKSIEEAVRLANDSVFGLGSCIWTNDSKEMDYFIDTIEAGCAFVNGMVASDPRLPFGGVKQSGYGRELSEHGIREFVNVKTIWMKTVSATTSSATATE